jgi:N-acylneuraminate cytidylyltransferase
VNSVAFIPARSGSSRVPDKNIADFGGHPLMARTITAARNSGVFDDVICITDSRTYAEIAEQYGASVPELRPASTATDQSRDIEWLRWAIDLPQGSAPWNIFAILRPTSPFRLATHIAAAHGKFLDGQPCDSLRAVRAVSEHPGKMWSAVGELIVPIMPFSLDGQPWHSSPTQALPQVYVQDASLEIGWVHRVRETGTISGHVIRPFINSGFTSFDINSPEDLAVARALMAEGICSPEPIFEEPRT